MVNFMSELSIFKLLLPPDRYLAFPLCERHYALQPQRLEHSRKLVGSDLERLFGCLQLFIFLDCMRVAIPVLRFEHKVATRLERGNNLFEDALEP